MIYFTYNDLKVNTEQKAYPNRVEGGQFLTLKFDPHFNGLHFLSLFQS